MAFSTFAPSSTAAARDEKTHLSAAKFLPPWRRSVATPPTSPSSTFHDCQEEGSSTDAGDDIIPVFVDFTSCTSDGEVSENPSSTSSPRGTTSASVFSVMTLLRFRAAVDVEDDPEGFCYSSQDISVLPSSMKPKASSKGRTSSVDDLSWRQASEALPTSSAESWVAQQRNRNPAEDESVTRAARSILNKLTVEKFDALFGQLTNCGIKQPHHISILMREVFEKATTQHHFIPMYAELCVKLEKDPQIVAVVEEADESGQLQNFRRLLLNECQHVFMQIFETPSDELEIDGEAAFRRKQQAIGNMKLIGRLLEHGMLSSDLFALCCEECLQKHEQSPYALEALAALVTVAGPKFDETTWQHHNRLQRIFSEMSGLTKAKTVAPRLRFLMRDVLDAREAGWPAAKKGPTTLEEVKNDVAPSPSVPSPRGNVVDGKKSIAEITSSIRGKQQSLSNAAPWKAKKQNGAVSEEAHLLAMYETSKTGITVDPIAKEETFDVVKFRREVGSIFTDLASDRNIPAAVQRVRLQKVPIEFQAPQYVDILTRIVEERRGAVRRCELAFITGLAAADNSAFEREECLKGIGLFFRDVFADLCDEVHRLPAIMKSEFMPTMTNVFATADLNKVVPSSMRK